MTAIQRVRYSIIARGAARYAARRIADDADASRYTCDERIRVSSLKAEKSYSYLRVTYVHGCRIRIGNCVEKEKCVFST